MAAVGPRRERARTEEALDAVNLAPPTRLYWVEMVTDSLDRIHVETIRLAQRGDRGAFETLLIPELDRLTRLAAAILGNEADARDVVQDTLVIAWRRSGNLREPAKFRAWLTRILVNESLHLLREQKRRSARENDAAQLRSERTARLEDTVAGHDALERAFDQLDASQRALLVLHHLNEESVADIGFALQIPTGTVKSRLANARDALSTALAKEKNDGSR